MSCPVCPDCQRSYDPDIPLRRNNHCSKWKKWFAWHPIKIDSSWVWWRWVERQQRGIEFIFPGSVFTIYYYYCYRSSK